MSLNSSDGVNNSSISTSTVPTNTSTNESSTQPSVYITLYAYGDIKADCLTSHIDTIAHITTALRNKRAVKWSAIREDALICRSRSRALSGFMASGLDVWLQLDHDIQYNPEDLFTLADIAHSHRKPVCVPYSKRALPPVPAIRTIPSKPLPPAGSDTITEINAFATGFLAIPRYCLEDAIPTLLDPGMTHPLRIYDCQDVGHGVFAPSFPSLFQPFPIDSSPGRYEYLSEDYAASVRLKACGHEPYAWSKPILGHVSNFAFKLPTGQMAINT